MTSSRLCWRSWERTWVPAFHYYFLTWPLCNNAECFRNSSLQVSTIYISCPSDSKQTLGIKLPFLVMIIKNLKKYFSFEVQVLDDKNVRRRFRASNYQVRWKSEIVHATQCTLFTSLFLLLCSQQHAWSRLSARCLCALMRVGTRFNSTCPTSLVVHTERTSSKRYASKSTRTAASDASISLIDSTPRRSYPQSSNYSFRFRRAE